MEPEDTWEQVATLLANELAQVVKQAMFRDVEMGRLYNQIADLEAQLVAANGEGPVFVHPDDLIGEVE